MVRPKTDQSNLEATETKRRADLVDAYVGRRMRQRREMLGMSQQDVGAALNVSYQQVQKYETSSNRIAAGKLYSLAQLLDVPIDYFFCGAEELVGGAGAAGGMASLDAPTNIEQGEQLADGEMSTRARSKRLLRSSLQLWLTEILRLLDDDKDLS